mmetsp:Transcript_101646/g.294167  ORF Transcript_101646/g.294167 Transcript_101646/m.294167 type:complete len:224 (+) Transcript_101646:58-729(+)
MLAHGCVYFAFEICSHSKTVLPVSLILFATNQWSLFRDSLHLLKGLLFAFQQFGLLLKFLLRGFLHTCQFLGLGFKGLNLLFLLLQGLGGSSLLLLQLFSFLLLLCLHLLRELLEFLFSLFDLLLCRLDGSLRGVDILFGTLQVTGSLCGNLGNICQLLLSFLQHGLGLGGFFSQFLDSRHLLLLGGLQFVEISISDLLGSGNDLLLGLEGSTRLCNSTLGFR